MEGIGNLRRGVKEFFVLRRDEVEERGEKRREEKKNEPSPTPVMKAQNCFTPGREAAGLSDLQKASRSWNVAVDVEVDVDGRVAVGGWAIGVVVGVGGEGD